MAKRKRFKMEVVPDGTGFLARLGSNINGNNMFTARGYDTEESAWAALDAIVYGIQQGDYVQFHNKVRASKVTK